MTEGKWIRFDEASDTGKTKVFLVVNKETNVTLGYVKWYGPFRQYSFFANEDTAYDQQCLMDLAKFLHHLMLERKQKKQLQHGQ